MGIFYSCAALKRFLGSFFFDFSNDYNLCNIYNNKFDFSLLGLNIREDNDRMKSYIGRNTAHILKTYKDREIIQKIL